VPVELEAFGLDVCRCTSDRREGHQQMTSNNRSEAVGTSLPGTCSTQDEVRQRSSEVGETWRQRSPDKSRARRSHHDFTTVDSASRGDEAGDIYRRKNCDTADDVRRDLGVRAAPPTDDRKTRPTAPRRHHSMTSLGNCRNRPTDTWRDGSRPQPDDVISATPPQVVVTSSGQSGTTSVLRDDVAATSGLHPQHHSARSSSSSSQRQRHRQSSSDGVRHTAYSMSFANTNSDQSYPPNRFATTTVPLPQTTVIDVIRKPVDIATQTR